MTDYKSGVPHIRRVGTVRFGQHIQQLASVLNERMLGMRHPLA